MQNLEASAEPFGFERKQKLVCIIGAVCPFTAGLPYVASIKVTAEVLVARGVEVSLVSQHAKFMHKDDNRSEVGGLGWRLPAIK